MKRLLTVLLAVGPLLAATTFSQTIWLRYNFIPGEGPGGGEYNPNPEDTGRQLLCFHVDGSEEPNYRSVNIGGTYTNECEVYALPLPGLAVDYWLVSTNSEDVHMDAAGARTSSGAKTYIRAYDGSNDEVYIGARFRYLSYGVSFVGGDDSTGSMASLSGIVYTNSFTLASNRFEKVGHSFDGWKDLAGNSYADGQVVTGSDFGVVDDGTNVVLTAQWRINKYTLTMGQPTGPGTTTPAAGDHEYDYGEKVELTATPSADGVFVKWSDGVTSAARTVTVVSNMVLSAKFESVPTCTVRFDANGGDGTMTDQVVICEKATPLTLNAFTRDGYTFLNWTSDAFPGAAYGDGASPWFGKEKSGLTIYLRAEWQPNGYSVRFLPNGGGGEMDDQTFVYDVPQALADCTFEAPPPGADFWQFVGWSNLTANAFYEPGESISNLTVEVNGVVDLAAVWSDSRPELSKAMHCDNLVWTNVDTRIFNPAVNWRTVYGQGVGYEKSDSCVSNTRSGVFLAANVFTNGMLSFQCKCAETSGAPTILTFDLSSSFETEGRSTNLTVQADGEWHSFALRIEGVTAESPKWLKFQNFVPGAKPICIDQMKWVPDDAPEEPTSHSLTIAQSVGSGSGTVSPAVGDHSYEHGTSVELSATPGAGSCFVGWNDGDTSNPRTIEIVSNTTVFAEFALLPEPFADGDVTVTGWSGKYDGAGHGVDVAVKEGIDGVVVRYAAGDVGGFVETALPWADASPTLTNAGSIVVWCEVSAPGYITQTNSATVVVSKRSVTLTSGSDNKVYDGTALTNHTVSASGDGFVDGEGAVVTYTGSQTDIGTSENIFTYVLAEGTLAGNYDVSVVYGELEVVEPWGGILPGEGTVTVPKTLKAGQKATWKATAVKGSVFSHWEGDFVETLGLSANQLRNPSLQFTVPDDFDPAGIKAVFIAVDDDRLSSLSLSHKGPLEPNVPVVGLELLDNSRSYVTASMNGLPTGLKFDVKTMAIAGTPTKPGAYVVKITAKNASGYQWAENVMLCVGEESGEVAPEPKRTPYYPMSAISTDAVAGATSGTGVYAEGKKVSISAKPARGFAFAGWYADAGFAVPMEFVSGDYRSASQSVTVPEVRYAYARFADMKDDAASLQVNVTNATTAVDGAYSLALGACVESLSLPKLSVSGLPKGLKYDAKTLTISGTATAPGVYTVKVTATNAAVAGKDAVVAEFALTVPNLSCAALPKLDPATDAYGVVRCGVAFDVGLVDCTAEDGWAVKAAGLPAGLKFAQDKGTGVCCIAGVPTKAGVYTVTFTATKKGEVNQTATITLDIEALPDWAQGTFCGNVKCRVENGELEEEHGLATMTVSAAGKVSGKVALGGTNWTFKADSYATVDDAAANFSLNAKATAGKAVLPVAFTVRSADCDAMQLANGVAEGTFGGCGAKMWRTMWKDKSTAAAAKAALAQFEGVYTAALAAGDGYGSGYLSLTVGKTGDVKATGKLADGTSVSATSPLMYDETAGWLVMLYAAPSAYKGGAFALGVCFDVGETIALTNALGISQWTSRDPQATGVYGAGFSRAVSIVGAYYDKAQSLGAYYDALQFSAESSTLNGQPPQNEGEMVDVAIDGKGKAVPEKTDGALSLSFTQATGVFKGGYTFVFDAKTKKKVSFEGIMVQGVDDMSGFYLWDAASSYADQTTGREKTYKYKESHSVLLIKQ